MAKTVMLSEEVYKELKELKELKNKSYSETVKDLMESKKIRAGKDLRRLFGIAKDKEGWDEHLEELREGWKRWSERYA